MTRYEGHLARQLAQTLVLLERLRDARAGSPPPPPPVRDVTAGDATPKALPARA